MYGLLSMPLFHVKDGQLCSGQGSVQDMQDLLLGKLAKVFMDFDLCTGHCQLEHVQAP